MKYICIHIYIYSIYTEKFQGKLLYQLCCAHAPFVLLGNHCYNSRLGSRPWCWTAELWWPCCTLTRPLSLICCWRSHWQKETVDLCAWSTSCWKSTAKACSFSSVAIRRSVDFQPCWGVVPHGVSFPLLVSHTRRGLLDGLFNNFFIILLSSSWLMLNHVGSPVPGGVHQMVKSKSTCSTVKLLSFVLTWPWFATWASCWWLSLMVTLPISWNQLPSSLRLPGMCLKLWLSTVVGIPPLSKRSKHVLSTCCHSSCCGTCATPRWVWLAQWLGCWVIGNPILSHHCWSWMPHLLPFLTRTAIQHSWQPCCLLAIVFFLVFTRRISKTSAENSLMLSTLVDISTVHLTLVLQQNAGYFK